MKYLISFFIGALITMPQAHSMNDVYWSEQEVQILKKKEEQEARLRQEKLRLEQQKQDAQRQERLRQQQIQEAQKIKAQQQEEEQKLRESRRQEAIRQEEIERAKLRQEQEEALRQEEARRQEEIRQAKIREEQQKQDEVRRQEEMQQEALHQEEIRKEQQEQEEARRLERVRQEEEVQQLAKMRELELEKERETQLTQELQALSLDETKLSQAMHTLTLAQSTPSEELVISVDNPPLLPLKTFVVPSPSQDDTQAAAQVSEVIDTLVSNVIATSHTAKALPVPPAQDVDPVVKLTLEFVDGDVSVAIIPVGQTNNPDIKKEDLAEKKDAKLDSGDTKKDDPAQEKDKKLLDAGNSSDSKEVKKAIELDKQTLQYITLCNWDRLFTQHAETQLIDIFSSLEVKQIDQPDAKTGLFPLHYAASFGFVDLATILVNHIKVNVNALNPKTGMNALHYVMLINGSSDEVNRNCAWLAKLLIEANIDTNCKTPKKNATALYYATINNRCLVIPILLEGKADMHAVIITKRHKNTTPLEVAQQTQNQQMMLPIFTEFARSQEGEQVKKSSEGKLSDRIEQRLRGMFESFEKWFQEQ